MNQLTTPALEPRLIMVPIARLNPIAHGVRRTNGISVDSLAASIAAEGLLQNLTVIVDPDAPLAGAQEFQNYQVIAGSRRLRALRKLVADKVLQEDYEVPCRLIDGTQALTASLAENAIREPMHPADEFIAFRDMIEQGKSIDDVSARFGVTPLVVQRRLKLANVSPKLFELFRKDEMSLQQIMALAIVDDHGAQEKAWKSARRGDHSPPAEELRAILTKKEVDASRDPVARFVGTREYEGAGGQVHHDLFDDKGAGYFTDAALLRTLAAKKLEMAAESVRKEGWSWVEVRDVISAHELYEFSRADPTGSRKPGDVERARTAELEAQRAKNRDRLAVLRQKDDQTDQESDEFESLIESNQAIEAELNAMRDARAKWDPPILAQCGAIVAIDRATGTLAIMRGLCKGKLRQMKDKQKKKPATKDGSAPATVDLSAALTRELTAATTLATAAEIIKDANGHGIALLALTHKLVQQQFYRGAHIYGQGDPVTIEQPTSYPATLTVASRLERIGDVLKTSSDVAKIAGEREALKTLLPKKSSELFAWLMSPKGNEHWVRLLAFCVAESLDGIVDKDDSDRIGPIARALKVDMRTRWQATPESYLSRVPAAQVNAALADAGVDKAERAKLAGAKKSELIAKAQPLLKNWVPQLMRFGAACLAFVSICSHAAEYSVALPAQCTVGGKSVLTGTCDAIAPVPTPTCNPAVIASATPGIANFTRLIGTYSVNYFSLSPHDADVTDYVSIFGQVPFATPTWPGNSGITAVMQIPTSKYVSAKFTVPAGYMAGSPANHSGYWYINPSAYGRAPISATVSACPGDFSNPAAAGSTVVAGCYANKVGADRALLVWESPAHASPTCALQDGHTYYLNIINADISVVTPGGGAATSTSKSPYSTCAAGGACSDPIANYIF